MREADNLTTFMCRMSWKSGSLNLLEPSGGHRACYETALPLPYQYGPKQNLIHHFMCRPPIPYSKKIHFIVSGVTDDLPYFPPCKTHRDFFVRNLKKNNDECILILVIYWKKTGLLHTKISNHNIIYWKKTGL